MNSRPDSKPLNPRIGVIIIPTDPYWIQALQAIIHANQIIGDDLVMLQPTATLEGLYSIPPYDLVDQVLAHKLDSLICTIVSIPVIQAFIGEGLPVICLAEIDYHHPLFTAMSSLYDGGKVAGQYIGQKLGGKGNALCITAGLEKILTTGQSRLAGFRDSLQAFPEIIMDHIPAYWSYAQAYPSLLATLKNYPRHIDAIFGVSDTIILAARDAARELGIIDDRTVLVGLNGDPLALAAVAEGDLSATIDTASEDLGARATYLAHQAALGLLLPDVIHQGFQLITQENVASVATRKLTAIAEIPSQMVGYSRQKEHDRLSQLEISMEITQQIGSLQEHDRVIQVISELVCKHYGYEWVRILRWSKDEQNLVLYGGNPSPLSIQFSVDQDWLLNQAFRSNEAIYIPDMQTSHRWQVGKEWEPVRSRALLPIQLGSDVIGILDLQSSQPVRQPSLEFVGLKLLASQLGIVIHNTDLYFDALKARETAERANQLKNRLIANVGHEMRTPLNAILGFSQSIQKQVKAGREIRAEDLHKDIQYIFNSGEHLMYMINDLLDLSRAEIGALSLYFEQLQPAPFMKELFWSFAKSETASQEVSWVLEVPDRLPMIRADVVRLRQILTNLLVNAQKFTRHGSITLGAATEPPYLHLWVRDTGPGVPIDLQEKIFEPFSTSAKKRRPEGIGLGLSITRHLVLLHGGIITLESQPGMGSTFNVYLPLPGITQEPVLAQSSDSRPVMLVISNQSQIPEELRRICERQNLFPRLIAGRDDLAQALAEGKPLAVAWDLASASSKEWGLIQRLSLNQECAALPIILYGMEEGSDQLKAGLTNVFFKPCTGNTLKDWISQIGPGIGKECTILVVDDDPQARNYYQKLLESSHPSSRIILAENGSQALQILRDETPAFILLDLIMPEVDGFTVLEWVRNEVRTQHIPVIVISGKLLNYEDIQRLNYYKTVFVTKGILTEDETIMFLGQIEGESRSLPQPTSLLIKQVLAFLHQNYSQPIKRRDIADAVGVSENYLSQIFRQEITISPWDYLNRYRIHKAKGMLSQTQDTITRIATQVGFNDSAYFSRVFRKLTGHSPHEFRQLEL
jgi:signal transduction histidine kinase/AraC-like DNA-binding protein/ABC-type sugar transport system substrate-binding protein